MTQRIVICRHSNAGANLTDPAADVARTLTPKGHKQARKAGKHLRDAGITRLYTSPLARAAETATGIVKGLTPKGEDASLTPHVADDLADGSMTAKVLAKLAGTSGVPCFVCHGGTEGRGDIEKAVTAITGKPFGGLRKSGHVILECYKTPAGQLKGGIVGGRRLK
jgi:hypothetical protein